MTIQKLKTLAIVLLLLCSVCITPVMAGNEKYIIVDGVHFIEYDDSPTILDPNYYKMTPPADFVIDGDQFYWVRIGSVRGTTLSSNVLARLLCKFGLGIAAFGAGIGAGFVFAGGEIASGGALTPVIAPAIGVLAGMFFGLSLVSDELCLKFEKLFVEYHYQIVASDGMILMCIDKNNVMGIQELQKSDIDMSKLAHLTTGGQKKQQEL